MALSKKIVIATHQMLYGAPQALRDYLLNKKTNSLFFIGHPLVMQRKSFYNFYKNSKQIEEIEIDRSKSLGFFDFIIDFSLTIWWVYKQKKEYDIFVGVDGLNCLAGLFLKKIGRVKKVIFYSIDFSPIRFKNNLLNFIYHKIEELCVRFSDECWNVSPRIAKGREKFLNLSEKIYPQKVVPIGVWNSQINKVSFNNVNKNQLVFLGHLLEKQGVQVVLEAMPFIIQQIPDFKFMIIGGGSYEESLKKLSENLKIEKYVEFRGWVKDRKKMNLLLGKSAAAIATYKPEEDKLSNFTYYADPTKIKDYLASGLPVILTNVSYNAHELEKRKCGIVVEYRKEEVSQAVINLLKDKEELKIYRQNAYSYANEFDWSSIFSKTLNI